MFSIVNVLSEKPSYKKKTLPCLASFLLFETFLKKLRFSARIRAGCSGHLRSWDLKFVQFSRTSTPLPLARVLVFFGGGAKNKNDKNRLKLYLQSIGMSPGQASVINSTLDRVYCKSYLNHAKFYSGF